MLVSSHKEREVTKQSSARVFHTFATVLMVLALLYFGKAVLVPIALSVLLAFVLTPPVVLLEKWRLGRTISVLVATGLAFLMIGLSFWALAAQVQKLAADLPNHKQEMKQKIASLQMSEHSTFARLTTMFNELFPGQGTPTEPGGEIAEPTKAADGNVVGEQSSAVSQIYVAREAESPLAAAVTILLHIVEPLATAALVIVLVMFLLIRREDVRYRLISLLGDAALSGTTRLIQDTAERVSKYLLSLLIINAGFGLVFGIGLFLLGVPYASLWGFLTCCLRFIPFLGSPASVLFPLLISIATSTGWTEPIGVVVFFTIAEVVTANVIEPVLFGKTTGLTPIALLIAALFWAWIWGPLGLLLSTPLTVCLVVLGQHLPHLRSLKVLLAEQPVLDARLQYFQRMLVADAVEGKKIFEQYKAEFGKARAFDEVLVPALGWTRRERTKESITAEEEHSIWQATWAAMTDSEGVATEAESTSLAVPSFKVFGYPVHHESEEIALSMLAQLLEGHCKVTLFTTKQLPSRALSEIEAGQPDVVVLAILPPGGLPQVEYMCQEVRSRCPDTQIIITHLDMTDDYNELLVRMRQIGGSYLTTSLAQTQQQIETLYAEYTDQAERMGAGDRQQRLPTIGSTDTPDGSVQTDTLLTQPT